MKKLSLATFAALFTAAAFAAPGTYWEVNTKTEMPGMPMVMPPTTQKVCIGTGSENQPRTAQNDKNCKMTDLKVSGNKTTWKMTCNHNGDVMNGEGQQTTSADSFQGTMRMIGKSGGHDINMTSTYNGKRVGGSCDTQEAGQQAKQQADQRIAQQCDVSNRSAAQLIATSSMYIGKSQMCASQRDAMCDSVRKGAAGDADTYRLLLMHDQDKQQVAAAGGATIAKACGIDMTATTRSVCKTLNDKNLDELSPYCPAEAKAWREAQRKKDCEGREYTAKNGLQNCLSGKDDDDAQPAPASKKNAKKTDKSASDPSLSDKAVDGAKKLKGLLGF